MSRKDSLTGPILSVVLDVASFGADPQSHAAAIFDSGADWIQLRDRDVDDDVLFATACALVRARNAANRTRSGCAATARVIINKRPDIARASGADGVHLGFDAISQSDARSVLGEDALIGRSLHSADEVTARAKAEDIDYAHLAPIWNPNSKPATRPALGVGRLGAAAGSGLPLFAQGGVTKSRAAESLAAGALGIAVTGSLRSGGDPVALLAPLRQTLDVHSRSGPNDVEENTSTSGRNTL